MNLDPNQSFRHNRVGKHAAAVRDGRAAQGNAPTVPMQAVSQDQMERSNAPTVTLKTPAEQAKDIVLALDQIRAQCAGDNWVTLEIPRKLWSDIRAAAAALEGK